MKETHTQIACEMVIEKLVDAQRADEPASLPQELDDGSFVVWGFSPAAQLGWDDVVTPVAV